MKQAIFLIALVAGEAAAAPRPPDWVDHPPSDAGYIYVVGNGGPAKSVAEAEKSALTDALDQIARQISTVISARTISTLSNTENTVLSESRQSVRARITDAEAVGAPWVEVAQRGIWPFRRAKSYTVSVLVRYPRVTMARERERQASAWAEYKSAVDRLAQEIVRALRKLSLDQSVAVGAFTEATTHRSYAFGDILKHDLADGLVRSGIVVLPKSTGLTITGAYRVVGAQVVVTARIVRASGERVAASDIAFDRDVVPEQWLEIATPMEAFFESAEAVRSEAKGRVGTISVVTKPETSAQVFVDGDPRGRAPAALGGIPVGLRSVTVATDGFEPFIAQVQVVEGETTALTAPLKPLTGSLDLRSVPTGATVVSDGHLLGKTPLTLSDLPVGSVTLTLRLEDHEDEAVTVKIESKKITPLTVTMRERPGSILVLSEPGATVMLDGVEVGIVSLTRSLKLEHVAAGQHQISANKKGVGVWAGTAVISANKTMTVEARLKNNAGMLLVSVTPPNAKIAVDGEVAGGAVGDDAGSDAKTRSVEDLLQTLPGMGAHVASHRWNLTIENLQHERDQDRVAIPLEAGEHEVIVSASGFQGERRMVRIRAGKTRTLRLELIPADEGGEDIVNGAGDHLFYEMLPLTKGYLNMCRRGDASPGVKIAACTLTFPIATVISLGFYPLVGDVLALPYHAVKAVDRRLPDRGDRP